MTSSKFSEEPLAYALRQAESRTAICDVYRQFGSSEAMFYLWRNLFARVGVSELRRLRSLEEASARPKRVLTSGHSTSRSTATHCPTVHAAR